VRAERVPEPDDQRGFAELAPDLVVDVVSPNDPSPEVSEKAFMWLDAGVRLVWVVDPKSRSATVYRPGNVVTLLRGEGAELDGEDVLPGFTLALSTLFD
jgi:Uma2 family endonuclease